MQTQTQRPRPLSAVIAAMALLGISACSTHTTNEIADAPSSDGEGKYSGQATNGYSKPGAPITLQTGNHKVDAAGDTVAVTFVLTTSHDLNAISASLNSEQLNIGGPNIISIGDMAAGESKELTAFVTPMNTGRQYLSVVVTGQVDGHSTGRAFAIPVDVAGNQPSMKSNGEITTDVDGQKVISMPADES